MDCLWLLGQGSCFGLWEAVKRHAGYYPAGRLAGIGFSARDDGTPVHDVCSPEWTFGAINMCRILAAAYDAPGPFHDSSLAARLREDEQAMLEGVAMFEAAPDLALGDRAYLYANRVADTGFGWQALPVPSLCATSWAMMVEKRFNPFHLGGGNACVSHEA